MFTVRKNIEVNYNRLYNTVFQDWANLEKYIPKELSDEIKNKIKLKKISEIKGLFQGILRANSTIQNKFRILLRTINNQQLEKILFTNNTDKLVGTYTIPDEKVSEENFKKLFETYLYKIDKEITSDVLLKRFIENFKLCKFVGDFIENNNNIDNSSAYLHAYKMLMIFDVENDNFLNELHQYLERNNYFNKSGIDKPLHDALIYSIPDDTRDIQLKSWQALIKSKGAHVLKYFNRAHEIEKHLGRMPKNIEEIEDTLKKISYKRCEENPVLALLGVKYNLSENLFNKALKFNEKRKTEDNLPNITISGSSICPELRDYYLVKLPIDDPHAYVLGHMTGCCQSIGGHSECCVLDGIQLKNNGFYVLLKQKSPSNNDQKEVSTCMKLGKIKYDQYDLVGQGYAWISKNEQLVFDSWENLNPSRDDDVVAKMLLEFSKVVTSKADSKILHVNIGKGGKTPQKFKLLESCKNTEKQLEGEEYGDASEQFVIYCNEEKRLILINDFLKRLCILFPNAKKLKLTDTENSFIKKINSCYSMSEINRLESIILLAYKSKYSRLFIGDFDSIIWSMSLPVLTRLITEDLLNTNNIKYVCYSAKSDEAIDALIMLKKSKAKGMQDVYHALFNNKDEDDSSLRVRADRLISTMELLLKANMGNNFELRKTLLQFPSYSHENCKTILEIYNKLGIFGEIDCIGLLALFNKNAKEIYKHCGEVRSAIRLIKDLNIIKAILKYPDYAKKIAVELPSAFSLIEDQKLPNSDKIRSEILVHYPKDALTCVNNIIDGRKLLQEAGTGNDENIYKLFFGNLLCFPVDIAKAFVKLKTNGMYGNKILYNCLLSMTNPDANKCGKMIEAYDLLDKAQLVSNEIITVNILIKYNVIESTKQLIKIISLLKERHMEDEPGLLDYIVKRYEVPTIERMTNLIDCLVEIKKHHLESISFIREEIFSNSCCDLKKAKEIIKVYAIIKETGFESNVDVCKQVMTSNNPEKTINAILECNKMIKLLRLEANKEVKDLLNRAPTQLIEGLKSITKIQLYLKSEVIPLEYFDVEHSLFDNFGAYDFDIDAINRTIECRFEEIKQLVNFVNKYKADKKSDIYFRLLQRPYYIYSFLKEIVPNLHLYPDLNLVDAIDLFFILRYEMRGLDKINQVYLLFKRNGLEINSDISKYFYCCDTIEAVHEVMCMINILKPAGNKAISELLKVLNSSPLSNRSILDALSLLKEHNLEKDLIVVTKVLNNPYYAILIAQECVEIKNNKNHLITAEEKSCLAVFCSKLSSAIRPLPPSNTFSRLNAFDDFLRKFMADSHNHTKKTNNNLILSMIIYHLDNASYDSHFDFTFKVSTFLSSHGIEIPDFLTLNKSFIPNDQAEFSVILDQLESVIYNLPPSVLQKTIYNGQRNMLFAPPGVNSPYSKPNENILLADLKIT